MNAGNEYTIKDGGKREAVGDAGMVRDTEDGKLDWSNLFQWFEPMASRYVAHMTKGRAKYPDPEPGIPNWSLAPATQEAYERFKRSFLRHVVQYIRGDTDEDHAAAIMFNLNGMEYVRGRMDHQHEGVAPHFTVTRDGKIFQHAPISRALRNYAGEV